MKLFITHGGIFSTQESTYHGVKVLGLPLFADQIGNMAEVQAQGWGKFLKWQDLSFGLLKSSIEEIINNEK